MVDHLTPRLSIPPPTTVSRKCCLYKMSESKRDVYLLNFDKMCRLCLSVNIDIVYIFNKNFPDNCSLKHRIKECVMLDVSENDGLPQNICNQCFQKVNEWHNFKKHCQESELTLQQHLLDPSAQSYGQVSNLIPHKNFSVDFVDTVKSENEEEILYPEVKQEESDNNSPDDLFSESDEKPLSEMTAPVKKKKREKGRESRVRRKKSEEDSMSRPVARGRAPKAKPFCVVCQQKFSRFVELIDHQTKAHNLNLNEIETKSENPIEKLKVNIDAFAIFKCHICKEEFSTREELRNHCKGVHNTKVIQPYPCRHCDRQFPAWGVLVVHERKHTGEKPYSCDVCGKQNFISQTSLRRHKLMHLKVYSCRECGRDFNCDSALKAHIRCKHTNEKPFLCNVCGRSFSLSAILMAHMTSHSTERKYVCDVCGFASKTSGNHYRHKNTHKTGGVKSFHCETCGKSFDSKLKLSSHQIIHRPVKPHVCKVCGKGFFYNNKLEKHVLLVHARERPFPCSLCGKKLASKFGLGIHMKTHNRNETCKAEPPEVQ